MGQQAMQQTHYRAYVNKKDVLKHNRLVRQPHLAFFSKVVTQLGRCHLKSLNLFTN
jgi:hypothetical protein